MKSKNIVVFYQYFGTPRGSWSTRVYELCRRWVRDGHKVTVVTAPYDKSDIKTDKFISQQKISGINVIVIDSGDSNRQSTITRVVKASCFSIISVYFALKLDYDVAIASSGPISIGLPLLFAKRWKKKKTIFEVRDLWPAGGIEMGKIKMVWQQRMAIWFEKLCYRHADHIVTASIGQKIHIQNRFPEADITVIPNASDLDLFGEVSRKELPTWTREKVIFTHIGSLGFIHNCSYWLDVAALVKTKGFLDIHFVFIGDGAEREVLDEKKRKLGLENLSFLGLMPKSELPAWVQASRATLFATLDNPVQNTCSPNKIFDSFAAGVPIIQTTTGWIKDLVDSSACGINVQLNDPELTANAIIELAIDFEKAQKLGQNAKRLAETEFNREWLANKYLKAIKGLDNYSLSKKAII